MGMELASNSVHIFLFLFNFLKYNNCCVNPSGAGGGRAGVSGPG